MKNINIVIAINDGSAPEILFCSESATGAREAFAEARSNPEIDFVGLLQKPVWHKRSTPKQNAEYQAQNVISKAVAAERAHKDAVQRVKDAQTRLAKIEIEAEISAEQSEAAKQAYRELAQDAVKEMEAREARILAAAANVAPVVDPNPLGKTTGEEAAEKEAAEKEATKTAPAKTRKK